MRAEASEAAWCVGAVGSMTRVASAFVTVYRNRKKQLFLSVTPKGKEYVFIIYNF